MPACWEASRKGIPRKLQSAYGQLFACWARIFRISAQQDVVAELVALVKRAWSGYTFWQHREDVEFFNYLGGVLDVPTGLGELPVNQL